MIFPFPAQAFLIVAGAAGLGLSALIATSTRFGTASVALVCHLAALALASGALGAAGMAPSWPLGEALLLAYSLTILAAPAGLILSLIVARENPRALLRGQAVHLSLACAAAPVLVILLQVLRPIPGDDLEVPAGYIRLGPAGYPSGLYLLVISIFVLANLERTLRSAAEHVRWEIKFLFIGLGAVFASLIYISSELLLSPASEPLLSLLAFLTLPLLLPILYVFILLSWRRSTGRSKVVVSQGVFLSSVTFLGVAVYLILSSFAAHWVGKITGTIVATTEIVFFLALVILAAGMLSTSFRHHVNRWVRRHVYSGRYDYRALWMEATDRFRESDSPGAVGSALADIIHGALGAIGVTVWIRSRDSGKLRLLAARDIAREPLPPEAELPAAWAQATTSFEAEDGASGPGLAWLDRALVVPLRSGEENVGFVTVGQDRSGRRFGWEARECLRVLASHAAAELHKRELLTARVEAKEAEAFRAFSTFLLHDLKNFASTLSLVAGNAVRHRDNPEFQRDAFRSVFETAEKMKTLCNKLRTFSGSLAARRAPADLNRLVREVAAGLDASLAERVSLNLEDVPTLSLDADEISSVVRNLVLNATEAISPDGRVTVRTAHTNGEVELMVKDDGPGMPREFLERDLFVPFRTTKSAGLGIGLFQSRKIIEAHGGSIEVESEEGKGTTVRAAFPVSPGANGTPGDPEPKTGAQLRGP
jgi:putative PEP-CTERM system histidine kinase